VPPLAERCIVSYRAPRKGSPRHYAIGGRNSTRDEVERTVLTSKEDQAHARRYERIGIAAPWMFGGGGVTVLAGAWTTVGTHNPLYLLISAVGLSVSITGFAMGVSNQDPLPPAMAAFNAKALAEGICDEKPFPPKPPTEASPSWLPLPSPAAPAPALPTLPAPNWTP
jgi:hypothetical protein